MKKLFLFLTALFTLTTVHADLILHESFDRNVGTLNKGANDKMGTDKADWWSYSGASNYIQVVEGSLSYDGYATAAGNKVELVGNGADDFRQFSPITSGKVYVVAIINVDSLKQYSTTAAATITKNGDYFLSFGDGTTSGMFARLHAVSVKEDAASQYTKLQLGISKNGEASTSSVDVLPLADVEVKKNILVVIEYEFVDGEKNDIARLYVNPTKDNQTPTLVCNQTATTSAGSLIGANNKSDAKQISTVNLRKGANTPGRVYVDEIKVATAWEDLFDEDTPVAEPAEITVTPSSLGSLQGFVGETYTKTFTVTGKNLTEDITLTSNSDEVTLDKTTISKDEATNATVTMTIAPQATGYGSYVVTLTSGEAKATVSYTYYNLLVNSAATIAELNAFAATASGWDYVYVKFTGEAVVTYKFNQSGNKLYLQDASGAVLISDSYWGDAVKQGDKVSNFTVFADATNSIGGLMYIGTEGANIDVLSHDNEVTPKVVTLAELQANPSDYLCQLVKVENVTFANTDVFASGDQVLQGDATATINLLAGNDLIGTAKVAPANVTGISSATNGKVLRVRGKQDVEKYVPSAIDNTVAEGEIEIYTVSGMRVAELQPGVNIIRQGGKTYKVVR